MPSAGALPCAALLAIVSTVAALAIVHEPRMPRGSRLPWGQAAAQLVAALRVPGLTTMGAFLFLWSFNPFTSTVLQLHMTRALGFSQPFYGWTVSVTAVSQATASLLYGLYCRRLSTATLVSLSVVLGVAANLGYWALADEPSAIAISMLAGFTSATAILIQLDMAARICPPAIAGTVFALLMGLTNLSDVLAIELGGYWYQHWTKSLGELPAFNRLVSVGAFFTAACSLLVVPLTRAIASAEHDQSAP